MRTDKEITNYQKRIETYKFHLRGGGGRVRVRESCCKEWGLSATRLPLTRILRGGVFYDLC